jgi:putative membrane protein
LFALSKTPRIASLYFPVQGGLEQPPFKRSASTLIACVRVAFLLHAAAGRRTHMDLKRIAYTLCFSAGTTILAGVVAFAQAPGSPQQPTMPSQQTPLPNSANPGPGAYPGTAPTSQDFAEKAFVSKALEGGQAEVQLGQLAQQKSQSNDVKQFAQKMVNDHSQMGDKWLMPVAKQLGVPEPKGPSKKDKKEIARLQGLSGDDFDREYITMMVKDHQQDLKDFNSEANAAQDPNVKQVAQQGAKVISQHLQLIEQIAKAHNIDVGGKEMSSTQ